MKKILIVMISGLILLPCFFSNVYAQQRDVVFGILLDGHSKRFSFDMGRFQEEIKKVSGNRYNIVFPKKYTIDCGWNLDKVKSQADFLLKSQEVDFIISLGPAGSHILSQKDKLSKPVIASIIVDENLQKLPYSGRGTGKANLNYIKSFQSVFLAKDFFYELTKFKHLGVVCDPIVIKAFGLSQSLDGLGKENEKITIISADENPAEVVKNMDSTIDAVLITPINSYSWEDFDTFTNELKQKNIPCFSIWGDQEVERGCAAGITAFKNTGMLARRIALQVEKILSGSKVQNLETDFRSEPQMMVNMESVNELGLCLNWDTILNSVLIYPGKDKSLAKGLIDIISGAAAHNAEFMAVRANTAKAVFDKKIANSYLMPKAGILTEGITRDEDSAAGSLGQYPEHEINLKFSVQQPIFDDEVFTKRYEAQKGLEASREVEYAKKLALAVKTSDAFFNYLKASKVREIKRNDLELSRANLERAKTRKEVGAAGPGDVYRWRSRIATSKKDLLKAKSREKQALAQLLRLYGDMSNKDLVIAAPDMDSDLFWIKGSDFEKYFNTEESLDHGKHVLAEFAIDNSPEINSYRYLISAREKYMTYLKRRHYLPKFYLKGEYMHRLDRSGNGSDDTVFSVAPGVPPLVIDRPKDDAWQVGVQAVLPLFEGFKTVNSSLKTDEEINRLVYLQEEKKREIREAVSLLLDESVSSWMNISLSQESDKAAKKNLELVSDAYQFGLATSVDLIDAQHSSLVSREVSTTAEYQFMENMYKIQTRLGFVDFTGKNNEKKKIKDLLGSK